MPDPCPSADALIVQVRVALLDGRSPDDLREQFLGTQPDRDDALLYLCWCAARRLNEVYGRPPWFDRVRKSSPPPVPPGTGFVP